MWWTFAWFVANRTGSVIIFCHVFQVREGKLLPWKTQKKIMPILQTTQFIARILTFVIPTAIRYGSITFTIVEIDWGWLLKSYNPWQNYLRTFFPLCALSYTTELFPNQWLCIKLTLLPAQSCFLQMLRDQTFFWRHKNTASRGRSIAFQVCNFIKSS